MNEKFDESSLNEEAITDVETARLALRWALEKIRALHDENLKNRQNLQEKSSQASFFENQLKARNGDIERLVKSHEEELKTGKDSLEYQFRSRLERLSEREKELEDKISRSEETLKQKETRLMEDYQKKSEELRGHWAQVEGEVWQLRQEQLAKQQEFERVCGARLEEEKCKLAEAAEARKTSLEASFRSRAEEFEKRENTVTEELKKQEAMLKWAKDSWQKEVEERERALKNRDIEADRKIVEKNRELDGCKAQISALEKRLAEFPETLRRREEEVSRYKDALSSLEGVIHTLETEKKNQQAGYEARLAKAEEALEAGKNRGREMEAEIPRRLKIAVEHERSHFAEKLEEAARNYRADTSKRQEEIDYLQRNLTIFGETVKNLQTERDSLAHKVEQLQTQHSVKLEEFSFRERQLQSEYDVRLKVETEKHAAALRAETETAGRMYEDSLRLKTEEIAHLRRDLEDISAEKSAAREQQSVLRRELEAAGERHQAELAALKARLKSEYDQAAAAAAAESENRRSADAQKHAVELEQRGAAFAAELARREDELSSSRLAQQKILEDAKRAVAEERARGLSALEEANARNGAILRLRDERAAELTRAIEASRVEREEMILLERERLQRLYSEKEKAMDEELSGRNSELARAREALAKAGAAKESLVSEFAAEKRAMEEIISGLRAVSERQQGSAEEGCEMARPPQPHGEREDAYRKTLEEFRSKLSDALGKFEALKKTAEEGQGELAALRSELARERKRSGG